MIAINQSQDNYDVERRMGSTQSIKLKITERGMSDDGAEDERERVVCTEEAERRMGGFGSFVRCGRRKVYRLSKKTL